MNPEDLLAHADFVRDVARSLVLDEASASDISQQTWLAAIKHPPGAGKSTKSWFARVVGNLARDLFRSESRRRRREEAVAIPEKAPSTAEVVEREETRRQVVEAVLNLDEPYRSTVLLRFYESLSTKDVAVSQGVPLETVRTRLKRGLAKLRDRLDRIYNGDRRSWCLALAPLAGLRPAPTATVAAGTGAAVGTVVAGGTLTTGGLGMFAQVKVVIAATIIVGSSVLLWQILPDGGESESPTEPAVLKRIAIPSASDVADSQVDAAGLTRVPVEPTATVAETTNDSAEYSVRVSGRFVTADGDPIGGVEVEAGIMKGPFAFYDSEDGVIGCSGGDGRFLSTLPFNPSEDIPRQISLRASRQGFANLEEAATLKLGETTRLGDLVMEPGGAVSGCVVDEEGSPFPSANVFCTEHDSPHPDEEGVLLKEWPLG
jgi:RNA polymerase sigma-70 factor (ECF subfamily)